MTESTTQLASENLARFPQEAVHDAATATEHAAGPHISIAAEKLGTFFGIPITNTLIMSFVVMIVLGLLALLVHRTFSHDKPGRVQTFFEMLFDYILDFIDEVLEDRKLTIAFFPLLATLFLFIWGSNWMEFLPGVGSLTFHTEDGTVPLLRSVNTDLNVTIALALIVFVVIEIAGLRSLGIFSYLKKFINFSSPLNFFIGLIELVSEFARLIAFSFRLFGNIFAGEVLIAVTMFFVPFFLPVPLMMFELFIGFIQAAVFALLTLFFVKIAITHPEH